MSYRITVDGFVDELYRRYGTTDGAFRGYIFLGYVGNSSRNYVTDAWVVKAANTLGWTLEELVEWSANKDGRWLMDSEPMSAAECLRTIKRITGDTYTLEDER